LGASFSDKLIKILSAVFGYFCIVDDDFFEFLLFFSFVFEPLGDNLEVSFVFEVL
jgi:hypothetical protein